MKFERETQIVKQIEALTMYRGTLPQRGKLRELIHAIADGVREKEFGEIREAHYKCLMNCSCEVCTELRKRL
ncbi:hypothetical protein ES707_18576 [subsurface metagenome]